MITGVPDAAFIGCCGRPTAGATWGLGSEVAAPPMVRRALILAAGAGTRLRPLTRTRPKAMVEIAGVPLLEHLLCLLASHHVGQVAINLHHLPEAIEAFAGNGRAWGLDICYLREPRLLGSGGTLRAAAAFLSEPWFLLYGDVLTDVDLGAMAALHDGTGAALTCLLHHVPDPWNKGIAEVATEGRVRHFVEKPPPGSASGNLAAAGIYVCSPAIVSHVPARSPCDFGGDVVPAVLAAGCRVQGFLAGEATYVRDIGTLASLEAARHDAANGKVLMRSRC